MQAQAATSVEKQAVLRKALLNVSERLAINQKTLGSIIGMSPASIHRLYVGTSQLIPDSKAGEISLQLIRIFRSLDAILGGDEDNCRSWFNSFNQHLSGIPAQLVMRVDGLVAVADYLDFMRGKL